MQELSWALRLLEALPGPVIWTQWIMFTVLQTGNHATFMQHCLDNTANPILLRRHRHPSKRDESGGGGGYDTDDTRRSPTINRCPLAEVLGWEQLARKHHWLISWLYLFIIIKYRVLSLVTERLGYMDCIIMGRFRYIGRTNRISGEVASVFIIMALLNKWTIYLCVPKFKFYALEFLMTSRREVSRDETALALGSRIDDDQRGCAHEKLRALLDTGSMNDCRRCRRRRRREKEGPHDYLECRVCNCVCKRLRRVVGSASSGRDAPCMNSTAFLRVPYGDLAHECKWILRPNRTSDSLRVLNLCTKALFYLSIYVVIAMLLSAYYAMSGSVLTNLGFEMAYPACVAWLRVVQSKPNAANNYSHIYTAPKVLAHDRRIDTIPARMPLNVDDLKSANLYTFVRIFIDILENHFIYLETIALFCSFLYTLVINSIDVILNARGIEKRLLGVLNKLEERKKISYEREAKLQCYDYLIDANANQTSSSNFVPKCATDNARMAQLSQTTRPSTQRRRAAENNRQLREEIFYLQAILADHFETITHGYNLYVSFILGFLGLTWLGYTVALCVWMSLIKSRVVEIEFLLAELSVTLFSLALTSGAAVVRTANLRLYQLITRAMALDTDLEVTKLRWISILKYFYPKPLHCFTLFGTTEISLLLGLKVSFDFINNGSFAPNRNSLN